VEWQLQETHKSGYLWCVLVIEIQSVHKSMYLLQQEALSIIPPMTGHTPLLSFGWQQPSECRQCVGQRCAIWMRDRQLDREDLSRITSRYKLSHGYMLSGDGTTVQQQILFIRMRWCYFWCRARNVVLLENVIFAGQWM